MVPEDFFGARPVDIACYMFIFCAFSRDTTMFSSFFAALLKKRSTLLIPAETRLNVLEEWLDEL